MSLRKFNLHDITLPTINNVTYSVKFTRKDRLKNLRKTFKIQSKKLNEFYFMLLNQLNRTVHLKTPSKARRKQRKCLGG